jgi:3-hydroxyacyl-CoA dehydrogenase
MKIKNASIAGGGSLGSQIAWQTAFKDFKSSFMMALKMVWKPANHLVHNLPICF